MENEKNRCEELDRKIEKEKEEKQENEQQIHNETIAGLARRPNIKWNRFSHWIYQGYRTWTD